MTFLVISLRQKCKCENCKWGLCSYTITSCESGWCNTDPMHHWRLCVLCTGTREAAFVHALSSAAVAVAVTRGCSRGELERCGCDRKVRGVSPEGESKKREGKCALAVAARPQPCISLKLCVDEVHRKLAILSTYLKTPIAMTIIIIPQCNART